jgi:hypothetical protein
MVCNVAKQFNLPVLSEDKQLLMNARKKGLVYFNCLMLVIALFYHEHISVDILDELIAKLEQFAWYDSKVFRFGQHVLESIKTVSR